MLELGRILQKGRGGVGASVDLQNVTYSLCFHFPCRAGQAIAERFVSQPALQICLAFLEAWGRSPGLMRSRLPMQLWLSFSLAWLTVELSDRRTS